MVLIITILVILIIWLIDYYEKNSILDYRILKKGGMYFLYRPLSKKFESLGFEPYELSNKLHFYLRGNINDYYFVIKIERTGEDHLLVEVKKTDLSKDYNNAEKRNWVFNASETEEAQIYIFQKLKIDFIK
jgi:hypothetical protein